MNGFWDFSPGLEREAAHSATSDPIHREAGIALTPTMPGSTTTYLNKPKADG